jgi:ABC-type phosphate transport system substrate-binding protein
VKSSFVELALTLAAAGLLCGPARAQVAVVMAPNASPLSKEQVANLYLGRSAELHLLDLPEGSSTRDIFYKKAAERDAAQVKATWSRIVFSGRGTPPKEVADAAAVKKAVAADTKSVGYIEKAAVDSSVKVVLMLE